MHLGENEETQNQMSEYCLVWAWIHWVLFYAKVLIIWILIF